MKWFIAFIISGIAMAHTPPERTWANVTTLSFVASSGNSSGETIGFANDYTKKLDTAVFTLKGKMLRAETDFVKHTAIGTSLEDAVVQESISKSVTAENYYLNARYDYRLKDKDKWYWYGGSSWEQNIPIGLNSRTTLTGGFGRMIADAGKTYLRIDAGLGATREEPTIIPDGFQKDFGTFNLTSSFKRVFTENIDYKADLTCTYNLKEMEDRLIVFKQALTVAMTKDTALKIGIDMNHRNMPGLISVRAYTPDDPPVALGNLILKAKRLDTLTTTSLVITF